MPAFVRKGREKDPRRDQMNRNWKPDCLSGGQNRREVLVTNREKGPCSQGKTRLIARVLDRRLLPSKNTGTELRSNDSANHDRSAVPDRNERNRIAPTVEGVSSRTNSTSDNPGDTATKP